MQTLFRKTLKLFAAYPILWLPFVCAELLGMGLNSLRHLTLRPLLDWFATRQSVLGGESQHLDRLAEGKTRAVEFLLLQGTNYLTSFLTAVALVLTASLVFMVLRGQKPSIATALSALRDYQRRIAVYALKNWALGLLFLALIGFPVSSLVSAYTSASPTVWNIVAGCEVLLTLPCVAWIMAPIALALLRPADSEPVSPLQKRQARYFWIAVGVVGFALSWVLHPLLNLPTTHLPGQPVLSYLRALLVASPNVLLYIALALIAADEPLPDLPPLGPRIRKTLEPLMPLHFRPSAEGENESSANSENV
jgi:hypothetical protein